MPLKVHSRVPENITRISQENILCAVAFLSFLTSALMIGSKGHHFRLEVGNDSWATSVQLPNFANKVLLEHSCTNSYTDILSALLSCYDGRQEYLQGPLWTAQLKIFTVWPFTEKVCRACLVVTSCCESLFKSPLPIENQEPHFLSLIRVDVE